MGPFRKSAAAARILSNPATWSFVASPDSRARGGHAYDAPEIRIVDRDSEAGMILIETPIGRFWHVAGGDLAVLASTYQEVFDPLHPHHYEFGECRVLPGDIVFDAGACEGFFTRFALERGARLVVAIEPWSPQADCLRRTFATEIEAGRVVVVMAALSDSVLDGTLSIDPTHPEGASLAFVPPSAGSEVVSLLTLDALASQIGGCDFLKADVEGSELVLLDGARKTLARDRPRVAMAAYHRPSDFIDLRRRLLAAVADYQVVGKGCRWRGPVPYPVLVHAYPLRRDRSAGIGEVLPDTLQAFLKPSRDPMPDDLNPYAAPETPPGPPEPASDEDRVMSLRRKNLGHEMTFRALGMVHLLGAGFEVVCFAVASAYTLNVNEVQLGVGFRLGKLWLEYLFLTIPILALLHLALWLGFRRFQAWAFWVQVMLSGASIVVFFKSWAIVWGGHRFAVFLIATGILSGIAHFAILYCLLVSNSRRILAPDYREVVAETPSVQSRLGLPLVAGIVPFSIAAEWGIITMSIEISRG